MSGAKASNGAKIEAQQRIDGAPSVLYDAVALLLSEAATRELAVNPALRDFISDAAVHKKFIGYTDEPQPCSSASSAFQSRIRACSDSVTLPPQGLSFKACADLRFWKRG
ncbi:MAG: hypothetical protein WB615_13760 [Candidatus Tumulicola sp.]